jgi:biopolymer transport protein ExbB/TolQ
MDQLGFLATAVPKLGPPSDNNATLPTYEYVWDKLEGPGLAIIIVLVLLSTCAWTVMAFKALQLRRARKYNRYFDSEFRSQKRVLAMFERRVSAEGCPLFNVYQEGCMALEERLRDKGGSRCRYVSLKSMEHIKGLLESSVAREAVSLESGIILLAVAVSGAPFLGLLGTVWGVMEVFSEAAQNKGNASLEFVAPGVAAALATTVAGLLVAIPSMFGYNWLVHNLRVATVEMDNFAQELSAKIETEYLQEVPVNDREPRKALESGPKPMPEAVDHPEPEQADETRVDYHNEGKNPDLLPPDAEVQS